MAKAKIWNFLQLPPPTPVLYEKTVGRFKFTYDHNELIVRQEEMGLFRSIIKIEPSQSDLFRFCEEAEDLYIWLSLSKVQTLSLGKAYLEPMKLWQWGNP